MSKKNNPVTKKNLYNYSIESKLWKFVSIARPCYVLPVGCCRRLGVSTVPSLSTSRREFHCFLCCRVILCICCGSFPYLCLCCRGEGLRGY